MKQAAFYCENCGKPVPLDAEACPHCQSRFTAVQCPQCSFIGAARLFSAGCPQCGYLAPELARRQGGGGRPVPAGKAVGPEPGDKPRRNDTREASTVTRSYRKSSSRLPGWFYTVASIVLLAALVALGFIALHLK